MTYSHKTLSLNFDNLVKDIAKVINEKFHKVQKLCADLNPKKDWDYKVYLLNEKQEVVFIATPYIGHDNKWYVDFQYEDTCCSNALPCEDYQDSIIGMTVAEIQKIFSADKVIIFDMSTQEWTKIIDEKL